MTIERFNELFNNALEIYESGVDMTIDLGCVHINELIDIIEETKLIESIISGECSMLSSCTECELHKFGKGCMVSDVRESRKFCLIMWALDKNLNHDK